MEPLVPERHRHSADRYRSCGQLGLEHPTTAGQTFAASALFTARDPFSDAIEQYDFWDTGAGGGHFMLNGQALGTNQDNYVSAGKLGQTTYVAGSGTDTLWVRVSEGRQWSPWSPSFTVSDPTTIGAGETLELTSAYSGQLSFVADTGTLKLDNSATFAGTVAGMTGQDIIDFADIDPNRVQRPSYSGDASGGTLTVADGHTARTSRCSATISRPPSPHPAMATEGRMLSSMRQRIRARFWRSLRIEQTPDQAMFVASACPAGRLHCAVPPDSQPRSRRPTRCGCTR